MTHIELNFLVWGKTKLLSTECWHGDHLLCEFSNSEKLSKLTGRERGVDTQLLLLLKTFHRSEYFEISEDQNNYLVLSHFITIALEAAHNAVLCNFGRVGGQNAQFIHSLFGGGARDAMFEKVLGWVMDTLFSEHMKLSLWALTTEEENNAKIYCVRRNYHCWTQFGSPMARIANPHSLSIFWYSKAYIETNCSVARKPINLVTIIILIITIKIVMIVIINMILILLTVHCCIWTGGRCNHCGSARPPRHSRPGSRGRRRIARPDHVDHGDDDDHDDVDVGLVMTSLMATWWTQ